MAEHDGLADAAPGDGRVSGRVEKMVTGAFAVALQLADDQLAGIDRAGTRDQHTGLFGLAATRHRAVADHRDLQPAGVEAAEHARAPWRELACQYVSSSAVGNAYKKQ